MRTQSATSFKSFRNRLTAALMLVVLLLAALPAAIVFAADTGFSNPSFAVTTKNAWLNPTYSFATDDLYTSTSAKLKKLTLSSFNIAAIASDSQIDGIEVTVEGHTAGRQAKVEISGDNGATWASPKQTSLSGTDVVQSLGGASDKWGRTWTAANFTNAQFKIRLTSLSIGTGTLFVDHVQVKVYYTPSGIPITVTADPQTKHYGYPEPVLTYQVVPDLLPGDTLTGSLQRVEGETPGTYAINQGSLSGGTRYLITYVGNFLTIDQAPLAVTAHSYTKLSADPDITQFDFSYTGFVFGEDKSALTTEPTCALPPATDQSVEDVYPITCSGGVADNYTFTYVPGTLTVKASNNVATDITLTPSSVDENHLAGFTVGTLTNNDPDPDPFVYTICGVDDGSFVIDGATLKTNAVFDFETKPSYEVCVQVDDGFHGILQKNLTVTVNDLPETFTSVGILDGWTRESTEFSNKGGSKNVKGGVFLLGDDIYNRQFRSILSFDTEPLPDNANITKITLLIRRQGIVGTNPFLTHGNIQVDIRNGYFGTLPVLQAADFQAAANLKSAGVILRTPITTTAGNNWYFTNLKTTAYPFLNKTGTTEFRLRFAKDDNNDFGADYLKFYSGNALNPANWPTLVVEYTLP